jgi:hypothetical protein
MVYGCGNSGADMVKIDRFGNARHLVDVAQETVQVQVVTDAVFVAFKVGDMGSNAPAWSTGEYRFRQAVACQVAMLAEICSRRSSDSNTFPTASS